MKGSWYTLRVDLSEESGYFFADKSSFHGVDSDLLQAGVAIEQWSSSAELISTRPIYDGDIPDIVCHSPCLPAISPRLRRALSADRIGSSTTQHLPVKLVASNGDVVHGFTILNVTKAVDALDRDSSLMLTEDFGAIDSASGKPRVTGIWTPAVVGARIQEYDIVRLLDYTPPILVSERFAAVFRDGNYSGAHLRPVIVT